MTWILTELMKLIVCSVLISIIGYLGYYLYQYKGRHFASSSYSLYASFILGILLFFFPIILQKDSAVGFSWGGFPSAIPAYSLGGLVVYGTFGYLIGNLIFAIAKYSSVPNIERFLDIQIAYTRGAKEGAIEKNLRLYLPPLWCQTIQFLIIGLVGTSILLLFYVIFGTQKTSECAVMVTFGIIIRILLQFVVSHEESLVNIFDLHSDPYDTVRLSKPEE